MKRKRYLFAAAITIAFTVSALFHGTLTAFHGVVFLSIFTAICLGLLVEALSS